MKKCRLDQLIFDRGLTVSRERAKTTVMSGTVFVDGIRTIKPGTMVSPDSEVEIRGETQKYVSRGGLKLERALDEFGVDPAGKRCIDCGASTGGFTDCLLQRGADSVLAVDVGYGQLSWTIRNDPRVTVMERTNVRDLLLRELGVFDLAVMDLSFISLGLVFGVVYELLTGQGEAVCLVKPQFEAGREQVGKKGVVRDPEVHVEVLRKIISRASDVGFAVSGLTFSPVKGPEGNIEFLAHLRKGAGEFETPPPEKVVHLAHAEFEKR